MKQNMWQEMRNFTSSFCRIETLKTLIILVLAATPFVVAGQKKVVVDEQFNYPDGPVPENWWSEGCTAVIKDGQLFVDADGNSYGASAIWLDKEIFGDFKIEFDACIVSSEGNKNNINCFFHYSHPDGTSLWETREERKDGQYGRNHKLNGFIVTFLPNDGNVNEARFRFRKNPDFELVQEQRGYRCKADEIYHIKI